MADDLTTHESVAQEAAPALPAPVVAPPPGYRPPLYGTRFALAYTLLAVLLGAGAGLIVVQATAKEAADAPPWSSWEPVAEGATPVAKEIADHVSRKYRLPGGGQLVAVGIEPLQVQQVPVVGIAVRSGPSAQDVTTFESTEASLAFVFCGLGEYCAIPAEETAEQRTLLRRQALELALYSFRYLDHLNSVVAFLPPPLGADPKNAPKSVVYFRREDFAHQFKRPLAETLLPLERLTPHDVPLGERELVDALTRPSLFDFAVRQAPDGNVYMILEPAA